MSTTYEGQLLTNQQRRDQAVISARLVARLRALWPLLDVAAIDSSRGLWLYQALLVVAEEFGISAATARRYFDAFRVAEVGARLTVPLLEPALSVAAGVALDVLGPVAIKQRIAAGVAPRAAHAAAFGQLARTAQLHVLDGGRGVIEQATREDRRAVGYQRVTDGDPCYFCAMLASRGPVYRKNSFANVKVHIGCGCTLEAAYGRDGAWTGDSQRYAQLWASSTRGLSGDAAVRAFRSAWNGTAGGTRIVAAGAAQLDAALVAEAKRLQARAQDAFKRGDNAERIRLQSEASAIWRQVYNLAGVGLDNAA